MNLFKKFTKEVNIMTNQTKAGSKKDTLKTQLMAAVSMLCIAGIALISATYAWFTFVSNPEVKDIDLYVKTADELYISPYYNLQMDPQHTGYDTGANPYFNPALWFATITKSMIADPADTSVDVAAKQLNAFPAQMLNASSVFTTANQNFFTRALNTQGYPTAYITPEPPPNKGYVEFELWAKSNNSGVVYLDGMAAAAGLRNSFVTAIETTGGARIADLPFNMKKHIENTVRIGVSTVSEGADGATSPVPRAVIWEPNCDTHLGVSYGGPGGTGKLNTLAITKTEAIPDWNTENQSAGGEGGKTLQITYDYITNGTNLYTAAGGPALDNNKIALFHLEGGRAVKFKVCIWIEGADADTVNNVANSYFRTSLMFGLENGATASWVKTDSAPAATPAP